MALWGGRFKTELDENAKNFNDSFAFDRRLYKQDILGSIAHATMLAKQNIITAAEGELIVNSLKEILSSIENKNLELDSDAEDIHSFVESKLIEKIGDIGKKLHTGRSRNDQVALDMKLYVRDNIDQVTNQLDNLLITIDNIIENNKNTYMPGFTHLQKAQPITLAHYMAAYREMFKRDFSRLLDTKKRLNECPLGSAALAGTVYDLDREYVAKELEFDKATENSLDSVSDRDYLLEYIFDLSIIMMHMSRLSEEIIIFNTDDYRYITISDNYSTGSSIMPQKKNPDMAELIRGKVGRVYGALMSLLTTMKALPLAYNKDMQEDKEVSFDAMDTVINSISLMNGLLKNIEWNKEKMEEACLTGFINATDVADYLVKKGVPFRDAHHMVGELILMCEEKNLTLNDLDIGSFKKVCGDIVSDDIYEEISLENCVKNRKTKGAPGVIK